MAKQGKAKALTATEHTAFLAFLENSRHPSKYRAIYLLGHRAGLRAQSIAGITKNDVLDSSGKLKSEIEITRDIAKGRSNYPSFFSHPELREALVQYLNDRPDSKRVDNLFITQKGTAYTANSISHLMLKLFKDAGLEGASSHSMRRSFATNAHRSGVQLADLRVLMNHRSISTTVEYIEHDSQHLMKLVSSV